MKVYGKNVLNEVKKSEGNIIMCIIKPRKNQKTLYDKQHEG